MLFLKIPSPHWKKNSGEYCLQHTLSPAQNTLSSLSCSSQAYFLFIYLLKVPQPPPPRRQHPRPPPHIHAFTCFCRAVRRLTLAFRGQ